MALTLTAVRYYTQADPYYYTVDNRPLTDLAARDDALNAELAKRTNIVRAVGSATPTLTTGPAGWTITLNGTGDYMINHTLASANIAAIGSVEGAVGYVTIFSISSTQVNVRVYNSAGVLTHMNFALQVSQYA